MDLSDRDSASKLNQVLQSLDQRGFSLKSLEERLTKLLRISPMELRMVAGALLLSSLVIALTSAPSREESRGKSDLEISTLIPAGQVLIPVQLKNFESVDSILGPFGVVDLFADQGQGASKPIARNIRLLRAPKNPSLFAVLVPQDQAPLILQAEEKGLYAAIKNQKEGGTEFVMPKTKASRITYASEEP